MGRHSVPDDHDDAAASTPSVLSEPRAPGGRPRPGRHSRGEGPRGGGREADGPDGGDGNGRGDSRNPDTPSGGLDVIETMLAGSADTGPVPAVPADSVASAAPETDESSTARIQPIVDPVLDEPVPSAVTTVIPHVSTTATATPPPADTSEAAAATPDAAAGKAAGTGAEAEGKAAAKAARAAEKQAAKAGKAAEKQATKAGKAAEKQAQPAADGKLSDLAVLRADSAARARVIAAVVAPFLLYVLVLIVLDAFDLRTALIWIWVPLVTAGVVAGLILDLAHRSAAARAISARERDAG